MCSLNRQPIGPVLQPSGWKAETWKLELWNNDFSVGSEQTNPHRTGPGSTCMSHHHLLSLQNPTWSFSVHLGWWGAQPSPSVNIPLPVLLQECRKGDISEKGPFIGDGLHMKPHWWERTQRKISCSWNSLSPHLKKPCGFLALSLKGNAAWPLK